jgi:hypothetical protein
MVSLPIFEILSLFVQSKRAELSCAQLVMDSSHRGGPGSNPGLVMWEFVMDISGALDRFSPRTSVSPANLHSICFPTIIFTITRCWHNRPGVAALPIAHKPNKTKGKIVPCSVSYGL